MQTRVAVMAVIVEDDDAAEKLNAVLHHYGEHIIGRDGYSLSCEGNQYHLHCNRRATG